MTQLEDKCKMNKPARSTFPQLKCVGPEDCIAGLITAAAALLLTPGRLRFLKKYIYDLLTIIIFAYLSSYGFTRSQKL